MATRKKRTPARKVTKKSTVVHDVYPKTVTLPSSTHTKSEGRFQQFSRRPLVLTLLAVVLIVGLLYVFRDRFIAATVNGQIISKAELVRDLEKQYGQQALDNIITKVVVEQEAKKRDIIISDEDIDAEIAEIEERFASQQQNLDDVLVSQGYSREELRDQIRLQLMVERMVAENIAVTDEDVDQYVTDNKDFLPTGVPEEQQRIDARENLEQEKINMEAQSLLQELKMNADIKYFSSQPIAPALTP